MLSIEKAKADLLNALFEKKEKMRADYDKKIIEISALKATDAMIANGNSMASQAIEVEINCEEDEAERLFGIASDAHEKWKKLFNDLKAI